MQLDDMILVSVDDHVCEPPDMWDGHLPATSGRTGRPRLVHKKDDTDVWVFEGQQIPNVGLNAVAGRPPEEYGMEPTALHQLRKGCYDVDARIDDMNVNGMLGSLCFPSVPGFVGELFGRSRSRRTASTSSPRSMTPRLQRLAHRHLVRGAPRAASSRWRSRLMWDPKLMADEVRRVARKGCHAITFPDTPGGLGYPSIHSDHWDPFWQACADEGTIVCIHIGSGHRDEPAGPAGAGRDHDLVDARSRSSAAPPSSYSATRCRSSPT